MTLFNNKRNYKPMGLCQYKGNPFSSFVDFLRMGGRRVRHMVGSGVVLATVSQAFAQVPANEPRRPDTTSRVIHVQKSFTLAAGGLVRLELQVPTQVVVTGSNGDRVEIEIKARGRRLQEEVRQVDKAVVVGLRQVMAGQIPGSELPSPATVTIRLPRRLVLEGMVQGGQVSLSGVQGELRLQVNNATLRVDDCTLTGILSVQEGNVTCRNTTLNGMVSAFRGSLSLTRMRGRFSASAAGGQVSVNSPDQPADASFQPDGVTLAVREGDVEATVRGGTLDFTWEGNRNTAGRRFRFSALNGDLLLRFPEGMSLDTQVDQTSADPVETAQVGGGMPAKGPESRRMRMDSDFAMAIPAEKPISHRGKTLAVRQGRQVINGTGNFLAIHASESGISLRKR